MTEAVVPTRPPTPMRILDSPIGKVIPVIDIVDYIGYSRSAITKAMKVWEGKISPHKTFLPLETPGGIQQCVCLTRAGVDYLFLLIHPSKSRMGIDQLMEFRKSTMDKMGVEIREPAPISITGELQQAKEYALLTDGNVKGFQAAIFRKHNMPELADALQTAPSNIEHGEPGWYNVTQFCKMFPTPDIEGHPERLNNYLQFKGYIYRENGKPRLQPKGEPHGKEYWFESPHGHREIRIRWRLSIMYACGLVKDDPAPITGTTQAQAQLHEVDQ